MQLYKKLKLLCKHLEQFDSVNLYVVLYCQFLQGDDVWIDISLVMIWVTSWTRMLLLEIKIVIQCCETNVKYEPKAVMFKCRNLTVNC